MRPLFVLLLILGGFLLFGGWILTAGPGSRGLRDFVRGLVEQDRLTPIAIGLFLTLTLGAVFVGMMRARQVDSNWPAFALQNGLAFEERSSDFPSGRVHGQVNGRAFELAVTGRWDLHQRERITSAHMQLELRGLPEGLHVGPRLGMPGGFDAIVEATEAIATDGRRTVETGDEGFERRVQVKCSDVQIAQIYLNEGRRRVLEEVVRTEGFTITGGALVWRALHPPTTKADLDRILETLQGFARRLED